MSLTKKDEIIQMPRGARTHEQAEIVDVTTVVNHRRHDFEQE